MAAAQASRTTEEIWAHSQMAGEGREMLKDESRREGVRATCPKCYAPLAKNAKFCPECGAKLKTEAHCTQCGAQLKGEAKFCAECGTQVGAAEPSVYLSGFFFTRVARPSRPPPWIITKDPATLPG
jgi:hypothetical protein